jgi:hypothetical protein
MRYSGRQKPGGFETTRPISSGTPGLSNQSANSVPVSGSAESESASISWEPVLTRPLEFDSSYFAENYQRRVRRIRPSVSHTAIAAASVLKPVVEKPEHFAHVRIGAGGQIGGGQSGFGLATELLMGSHLTIGLGLNRLKVAGEQFLNEVQYGFMKRTDFRRDYPGRVPADIRTEILDIHRSGSTWQLPVTFGYRISLGNSVTLTPSVGASFSLEAREKILYTHQTGPNVFKPEKFYEKCAPNVYNSWLVGIGIEKQWNH